MSLSEDSQFDHRKSSEAMEETSMKLPSGGSCSRFWSPIAGCCAPCCRCLCSCCSCICRSILSIPLGGIVGLILVFVAMPIMTARLYSLNSRIENLGGDLSTYIDYFSLILSYVTAVDIIQVVIGCRERLRTLGFKLFQHVQRCKLLACCTGIIVSYSVTIASWASFLLALLCCLVAEAFLLILLLVHQLCNLSSTTLDQVQQLLDSMQAGVDLDEAGDSVDDVCDQLGDSFQDVAVMFGATCAFVIGQVVLIAYWMKYQTLSQVQDESDYQRRRGASMRKHAAEDGEEDLEGEKDRGTEMSQAEKGKDKVDFV